MFYVFLVLIGVLAWLGSQIAAAFGQPIGIAFGILWLVGIYLYLFQALDENWNDGAENDGEHLVFAALWPVGLPVILWFKHKDREVIALNKKLKQELQTSHKR